MSKKESQIRVGRWYCWWLRNPVNSPVEVGCFSQYFQSFVHARWLALGCLNHQQVGPFFGGIEVQKVVPQEIEIHFAVFIFHTWFWNHSKPKIPHNNQNQKQQIVGRRSSHEVFDRKYDSRSEWNRGWDTLFQYDPWDWYIYQSLHL